MATQTVYHLTSFTSLEGLTPSEEKLPTITKHEVLIKIRAISLNYRDIAIATSKYPLPCKENVIPCSDAAGDIIQVGEEVDELAVGDKAIVTFDPWNLYGPLKRKHRGQGGPVDGVLAQYIVRPAVSVVKIPPGLPQSYSEWSTLVCTGATVWNALYGNVPLKPGQTVLFQGTGGISITGIILAKAAGAKTIITSSSDEKLALVKSKFQPDYTINYKTHPDWAAKALEYTNGIGVDYVLENGGAGTIEQSIKAIAHGGTVAVIGFLADIDQSKMPDVTMLALQKGCIIRGINIGPTEMLQDAVRLVAAKGLRMPVDKEFGFSRDEVIAAYEYVQSGKHIGKVSIVVE